MQRLTTRRHLRFLRYKIFRFRQAQQYIALVGLSFSCSTPTCGVVSSHCLGTRLLYLVRIHPPF